MSLRRVAAAGRYLCGASPGRRCRDVNAAHPEDARDLQRVAGFCRRLQPEHLVAAPLARPVGVLQHPHAPDPGGVADGVPHQPPVLPRLGRGARGSVPEEGRQIVQVAEVGGRRRGGACRLRGVGRGGGRGPALAGGLLGWGGDPRRARHEEEEEDADGGPRGVSRESAWEGAKHPAILRPASPGRQRARHWPWPRVWPPASRFLRLPLGFLPLLVDGYPGVWPAGCWAARVGSCAPPTCWAPGTPSSTANEASV